MKPKKERLFETVSAILYAHDFAGINFGSNPDEYDAEAAEVLMRLQYVKSVDALTQSIYVIFVQQFGGPEVLEYEAGDRIFREAAEKIWAVWQAYHVENKVSFWGI